MAGRKKVGIGIIGAGFLAQTRARCYSKAGSVDSRIVAVAETDAERGNEYAHRFGIPRVTTDFEELISMPEVEMVDLCVPNHLHRPMTVAAAQAGKHVVCTKPLTAYVGQDLAENCADEQVSSQPRSHMLAVATAEAEAMVEATDAAGVKLMYGENWVYSPSILKAADLIRESGGTILEMRGGECHSGSHSPFSKIWKYAGGGSLVRLGAHPIGTMLYLKQLEGRVRDGVPIRPTAISAEVGDLSRVPALMKEGNEWVARGWKDVENWASTIITFADGSRGIAWASDAVLGGMESKLEVFLSNCHLKCNLSPNNLLQAFAPAPDVFEKEYLMEKLETKAGWSTPIPDEDWTSGHLFMCEAFAEAVSSGQPALTDGKLGLDVVRVVYSAYRSAEEGRRISL